MGITTIPERLAFVNQTIESLLNQSLLPDAIYLNLPRLTRHSKQYPYYIRRHERVIVNECVDMGPISKLFPLLSISEPDDVIVLVDDDFIYNEYMIETLIRGVESYAAVGFSGRIYQPNKGLRFFSHVPVPTKATFLETFSGVAYKRWSLKDQEDVIKVLFRCDESFYCDDIVIGSILNTPAYIIPNGKCDIRFNDAAGDTPQLNKTNLAGRNQRVYDCVQSL